MSVSSTGNSQTYDLLDCKIIALYCRLKQPSTPVRFKILFQKDYANYCAMFSVLSNVPLVLENIYVYDLVSHIKIPLGILAYFPIYYRTYSDHINLFNLLWYYIAFVFDCGCKFIEFISIENINENHISLKCLMLK